MKDIEELMDGHIVDVPGLVVNLQSFGAYFVHNHTIPGPDRTKIVLQIGVGDDVVHEVCLDRMQLHGMIGALLHVYARWGSQARDFEIHNWMEGEEDGDED